MKWNGLIYPLFTLAVVPGCGDTSPPRNAASDDSLSTAGPAQQGKAAQMVFKNGFEGTTRIRNSPNGVHYDLLGNDGPSVRLSDWQADLERGTPYFPEATLLNAEQGTEAQRNVAIVGDPSPEAANPGNKVLRMRFVEKHIYLPEEGHKFRLQHEVANRNAPPPGGFIKEYYQKVKVYFSPSFAILEAAPTDDIGWLVLQEYWNDPAWDQPNGDGTFKKRHEARTGIEIIKENGALIFGAKGRDPVMEVPRPDNNSWVEFNHTFRIPFGKWITQEIYIKEGGTATGRFYMAVTVDGQKTVIVDKTGMTTSEQPGAVPDGMTAWSPMKVYGDGKMLDFFQYHKDAGGMPDPQTMEVYWDDLEIWLNRTPETVLGGPNPNPALTNVQVVGLGGLCLDAKDKQDVTATQMVVAGCDNSPSQHFDFSSIGELRPRHSTTRCVDVSAASTQDNAKIQLWECNGTVAQKWSLTAAGELRGPGGKCIDVDMAQTVPGTKVKLYTCKGNGAQKWVFKP